MRTIAITDGQILIDGQPRIILTASLFPFRVPRHQWASRMEAVKRLGYDAIDAYFPWNHHETTPGTWDFDGEKDVAAFLSQAADAGLLVLARPGPYICSEWDGGGLPAWLATTPGLRLRQAEPGYLRAVQGWYDRIIPIIAAHQYPDGGPVIMVQLENELDFFDCDDPPAYLGALAGLARERGLRVPLIACAGQGDISRATGDVADLIPAVNLYPSDDSDQIEAQAAYYRDAMATRGLPLIVTETNRCHRTLKRLLLCGAKLLGPYLQASGWNNAGGPSINNWGDPLGFMTHDYDFGGALDPDGNERADAAQARVLTGLIHTLGPRLATATPTAPEGVEHADGLIVDALDIGAGGQLIGLTNLTDTPHTAVIAPRAEPVEVPAGTTLLIVRDTIDGAVTVAVEPTPPPVALYTGTAPRPAGFAIAEATSTWETVRASTSPAPLETLGIYRGAGRYRATIPAGTIGLVLGGAADIVDVASAQWRTGWFAGGGTDRWLPAPTSLDSQPVTVTTRIWGHSNFDDNRLPSLRLGSLKGLSVILAVTGSHDITTGWTVSGVSGPHIGTTPPPVGGIGWMSSTFPQTVRYTRRLHPCDEGTAAIHAPGIQARADVAVRGTTVGVLTPLITTLLLGPLAAGDEISLTVTRTWGEPVGDITLLTGTPIGTCAVDRQDTPNLAEDIERAVFAPAECPVRVPADGSRWLRIPAATLHADGRANAIVRANGHSLLITAMAGHTNLGRLFVGGTIPGAQLRGGRGDLLLVPADPPADLHLLLEPTGEDGGSLTDLRIGGPLDRHAIRPPEAG